MAKVFISYSRKDIEFAKRLTAELQKCELDFWIDWEDISPTVDWWREIEKGIEEADIFIFLISPDSARSKVCGQEIDTAVKNGKRIVPIVAREIDWQETPPQLGRLNYIFFSRDDDFNTAVSKVITAIQTDYEWAATHRRLQVKALDWERNKKDRGFLLRGMDLLDAEQDLATNSSKEPHPTDLQREFVLESRKATDRQRRITIWVAIATAVALAALSGFGFYQAKVASDREKIARTGELAAQSVALRGTNFPVSLLLSVEAYQNLETIQSYVALLDDVQANPHLSIFLQGHTAQVYSVAFSPDGKILASGSEDNTIILWDITKEKRIGKLHNGNTDFNRGVMSVDFSPDGKLLASGSDDGTVTLWNVATQEQILSPLRGHSARVNSVAFSPDGKILASGSDDNTIILWNTRTGEPIDAPIIGYLCSILSVTFSPDGKTLAAGYFNGAVLLWNIPLREGFGVPLQGHREVVTSVAFSPDGKTLASGSIDKTVILWDLETQKAIGQPITEHDGVVTGVAFSSDSKIFASSSEDGTILLWDINHVKPIDGSPLVGSTGYVNSIAFIPLKNDLILASGGMDGTVVLWDLSQQQTIYEERTGYSEGYASAMLNSNLKTVAYANGPIIRWDLTGSKSIGPSLGNKDSAISELDFSPNGKMIASSSVFSNKIMLWDLATASLIGELSVDITSTNKSIETIAFGPNEKYLAAGWNDGTITLWDLETRKLIGEPLSRHKAQVESITFSPDGKKFVSGSSDSTINLWDISKRKSIGQPLQGPDAGIYSVLFSPDGKLLATAGGRMVMLWDVTKWEPISQPLTGHTNVVTQLTFSPDGKILASGSFDQTIILWDVTKQRSIGQPLKGHTSRIEDLSFSPDGKTLLSVAGDSIFSWNLNPQLWIEESCHRAGRNLTQAEWAQYFPNEEYHKTCNQWPEGQ